MRTAIQMNDPRVVDHFRVDDDGVLGLNDLVVAVVGIRQHRRTGREERQAAILKPEILGVLEAPLPLETTAADFGSRRRERGNTAVSRVGHDRGAQRLDRARAELAEEHL